jgi:hypothetical protein
MQIYRYAATTTPVVDFFQHGDNIGLFQRYHNRYVGDFLDEFVDSLPFSCSTGTGDDAVIVCGRIGYASIHSHLTKQDAWPSLAVGTDGHYRALPSWANDSGIADFRIRIPTPSALFRTDLMTVHFTERVTQRDVYDATLKWHMVPPVPAASDFCLTYSVALESYAQ